MKTSMALLFALILTGCSVGPNKVTYPTRAGDLRVSGNVSVLYGRCEQVPDMRSCLSSGAMEQGSS